MVPSKFPSLGWNRQEYYLSWKNGTDTSFVRFDNRARIKGDVIVLGSASCGSGYNSLAVADGTVVIIWENSPEGGFENCQVDYAVFECGDENR